MSALRIELETIVAPILKAETRQATFYSFVQDDGQIKLQPVYFIDIVRRLLGVFAEGLAPLTDEARVQLVNWQNDVHLLVK